MRDKWMIAGHERDCLIRVGTPRHHHRCDNLTRLRIGIRENQPKVGFGDRMTSEYDRA